MLAKFTRIIIIVVFSLLTLTWLFGGDNAAVDRANSRSHRSEEYDTPSEDIEQRPSKVHYADIPDTSTSSRSSTSHVPAPTDYPMFERKSPYAYVFYATADEYACSALISMNALKKFRTKHRIFALVSDKVNKGFRDAMEQLNVTVSVTAPPPHPHRRGHFKEESLLKMLAFKMHHIDRSLKRVIVLDADQNIYKPLDSLFGLPSVDFAAPRAYWRGNNVLSTTLMVISLSDRVWKSVEDGMRKLKENWYDVELVNDLFKGSAMVLPGQYAMVDDHFVNWDLPAWYRPEGDINNEGMVKEYSKADLADLWKILEANAGSKPQDEKAQAPVEDNRVPIKDLKKRSLTKRGDPKADDLKEDDMGEILTPEQAKKEAERANKDEHKEESSKPQQQSKPEEKKPEEKKSEDKKPEEKKPEEKKPEEKKPEPKREESTAEEQRRVGEAKAKEAEARAAEAKAAEAKAAEAKAAEAKAAEAKAAEARRIEQARIQQEQRKAAQAKAEAERNKNLPPPHPYTPDNHPNRGPIQSLWSQAVVMHFGKVLKPWEKDYEAYKHDKANMHPQIYETHRIWREDSQRYCPRVDIEIPEDRRMPGEKTITRYHMVNNV